MLPYLMTTMANTQEKCWVIGRLDNKGETH